MAHQTNSQLQKVIRKQKQTFVFALKHIEIITTSTVCKADKFVQYKFKQHDIGRKFHAHRSILIASQHT